MLLLPALYLLRILRSPQLIALAALALTLPGASGAAPAVLFVSPTGSDQGTCTSAVPCASFDRAYDVARAGGTVHVAGGEYPPQWIKGDSGKEGSPVVFKPAKGAQVVVTGTIREIFGRVGLSVDAAHVELRNMVVQNAFDAGGGSKDVTFRNMTAPVFGVSTSEDIRVIGGSIGPYVDDASKVINADNVTIDGVRFHDYVKRTAGVHMECVHAWGVVGLTIRRSRFYNCAIMDVFISNFSGPDNRDIVIENNWFDAPGSHDSQSEGFYPLAFGPFSRPMSNILIQYNSMLGSVSFDPGPYNNVRLVGNIGNRSRFSCSAPDGISFAYNVWSDAACSATDKVGAAAFADPEKFNLTLVRGAAAVGAGDPRNHPKADIDGKARPIRGAPDAGATQFEAASIIAGSSIGAVTLGASEQDVQSFYGRPRSTRTFAVDGHVVRLARYRRHRGVLWIAYDRGSVVGMGTTSSYYSLNASVTIGTPLALVNRWGHVRSAGCKASYKRTVGRTVLYFRVRGRAAGGKVSSISVLKRPYESCKVLSG